MGLPVSSETADGQAVDLEETKRVPVTRRSSWIRGASEEWESKGLYTGRGSF